VTESVMNVFIIYINMTEIEYFGGYHNVFLNKNDWYVIAWVLCIQ